MVNLTFAAILGVLGVSLWRSNNWLTVIALIALILYSRWETTNELLVRISQLVFNWDKAKGKVQMKLARDLKSGKKISAVLSEGPMAPPKAMPLQDYLSEDQVFEIVRALPGIREFIARVSKPVAIMNGLRPFEKGGVERPAYLIQVAENMEDHLATFEWILVDAKTGEVLEREND